MVRIIRLSPTFAVAGQLSASDFPEIAAQGFKSIICNRPDGEQFLQLSTEKSEQMATAAGLSFRALPLLMGNVLDPATSKATQAAIDELPAPVLAYCRSGTRSAMAWAATISKTQPVDTVMGALQQAEFEIPGLADSLRALPR